MASLINHKGPSRRGGSTLQKIAQKKEQLKLYPRMKKIERIATHQICQEGNGQCQCQAWRPSSSSNTDAVPKFTDVCKTCQHQLEAHTREVKDLAEEQLDRILLLVYDMDNILLQMKNEKEDQDLKRTYGILFQYLKKNMLLPRLPSLSGEKLGTPPFERPSIAEAITYFVMYKFGSSQQAEWQMMYDLAKMFLYCFNHWKLETPSVHTRSTPSDDQKAYKDNYVRWVCFCHVPVFCESLHKHDATLIFGQSLLCSVFVVMRRQLMERFTAEQEEMLPERRSMVITHFPRFLGQLETELFNAGSIIWKEDFNQRPESLSIPSRACSTIISTPSSLEWSPGSAGAKMDYGAPNSFKTREVTVPSSPSASVGHSSPQPAFTSPQLMHDGSTDSPSAAMFPSPRSVMRASHTSAHMAGTTEGPVAKKRKIDELLSDKVSAILENYNDITFKQVRNIKLIFYGAPRAGKTTLRKQLLRHVEGKRFQRCSSFEPSTNIAEVCAQIFVERIAMTSEENNEWKWSVQKLDHIAKALLQCLDNKQLQLEIKSRDHQETSVNVSAIGSDVQQKPSVEQQQSAESQDLCVEASNYTEIMETNQQERIIAGLNIKELFLNAVETGQWAEVMDTLNIDNATFLQIIDGGGQPSFQEIFPLLISGPSVTLLIFKLTDSLETSYTVQYQPESGSGGQKAWEDAYVVKDIISHAISSFVSQKKTTAPFPCKILLVGTHKDKLGDVTQDPHDSNKKAKIVSTAEQLHGWLYQSKAFESIQVRSIEDFINSIDNNDENDIVSIRKKIEETISQLDSQDIPAPWLVFDFVLRKYAEQNKLQKVAKCDCIVIASICGVKVDEVDVVLHYLHFVAGTLLYYSDIPTLNQYVITDFQLIFDSISKIIIQYFDDNSVHGPHMKYKNLLKQKGQLDASVLRDVQGCLTVDELISLLHNRHIISNIHIEQEKRFFMPSVLPKAELSYNRSSNSSSILVLFDHGYCPVGLFCAATTRLIVIHKWSVNIGELQFRNKINFYCTCSGKSCNVIFSAFSAHYEVCLLGEELPQAKCMIYQNINDVFAKVCEDMKYPSPSYGFYCPEACKYGDVSYLQYQHPAMCTFSCESLEMKCCYSGKPSDLTQKQKQWFPQVQMMSHEQRKVPSFQPGLRNEVVKLEGVPTVKLLTSLPILGDDAKRKNLNIIQRTSTCYTNLAMYLLDDDNCEIVDCLKEKCRGDPQEIVTTVYKKWISGTGRQPVTWQTLIDVLRDIELTSLAEEIETALNLNA